MRDLINTNVFYAYWFNTGGENLKSDWLLRFIVFWNSKELDTSLIIFQLMIAIQKYLHLILIESIKLYKPLLFSLPCSIQNSSRCFDEVQNFDINTWKAISQNTFFCDSLCKKKNRYIHKVECKNIASKLICEARYLPL